MTNDQIEQRLLEIRDNWIIRRKQEEKRLKRHKVDNYRYKLSPNRKRAK